MIFKLTLAAALAAALLSGCAHDPSPPPPSSSPSKKAQASPPEASTASKKSKTPSKAGKAGKSSKPDTRAPDAAPPAGSSAADISAARFARPSAGPVIGPYDGNGNKGIDFGGSMGDPVVAIGDGTVIYAGTGIRGYGQLLMVRHANNFISAYGHNSALLVKEKQAVKRGQTIARMGNTDSPKVKLHFELRKNGYAVDPSAIANAK